LIWLNRAGSRWTAGLTWIKATTPVLVDHQTVPHAAGRGYSPAQEIGMTKDFAQIANDVVTGAGLVRQGAPDTMAAFASLAKAATAPNALDTKTKELMAVAIGIAMRCDGCVAFHTKMAHRQGASREELLETVSLAIYMGGGPASVYGADAVRAYDQFSGHSGG
jgi:AhpD family alkylhydroperoxidase